MTITLNINVGLTKKNIKMILISLIHICTNKKKVLFTSNT